MAVINDDTKRNKNANRKRKKETFFVAKRY